MSRSLETLIVAVKELPEIKQRGIAAIIGATVADAATRPFHWLYDQFALKKIVGDSSTPEFWPESKSPIYTIPLGETSSYNDVMKVSLSSLVETKGKVDIKHISEAVKTYFGEGTSYMEAYERRMKAYVDKSQSYTNKQAFRGPVDGPWVHKAVLQFMENYKQNQTAPYGKNINNENDGFCLILPIIMHQAQSKDLWNTVAPIASILNTTSTCTNVYKIMTVLLNAYIQGDANPIARMKEYVNSVDPNFRDYINDIESNKGAPFPLASSKYGIACYLPGSFAGAYLAMLNCDSYADAVRMNITGGGCNCSRANIIGSCYGAKYGIDGIPIEWMKKVNGIENLFEIALKLQSFD